MNIKLNILVAGAAAIAASAGAADFDFESAAAEIRRDGKESLTGVADDTGCWMLSIGVCEVGSKSEKTALEAARTAARSNMAKSISVNVETLSESMYAETDEGVVESFRTWSRMDSNEMLKGLQIVKSSVVDGKAEAFALIAQKTVDRTAELANAMAALPPGTVRATGDGQTRDDALEAAKRSALEQVNGASVVANSQTVDGEYARDRVYADVQGLVSAYRLVAERRGEDGLWHVEILAEVSRDELQETYGAQLKSIGDPLFFVSGDNQDAVKLMSDYFIEKGFKTTTNKGTSDYKIELKTLFEEVSDPVSGDKGCKLTISAVCFDKAGVQLFSLENDPRKATSFTGSPMRQTNICVKKAVRQISKPLHERIQRAINDMVNNGRTVRMVFRNVKTKAQAGFIEALVTEVNDIPGASSATSSLNESVQVATLRFTLKGNPKDFLDALRTRVPDMPSALSVSTNKIVFEF